MKDRVFSRHDQMGTAAYEAIDGQLHNADVNLKFTIKKFDNANCCRCISECISCKHFILDERNVNMFLKTVYELQLEAQNMTVKSPTYVDLLSNVQLFSEITKDTNK